jgi:NAD(P) transhydrogenase subunit alpha
METMEGERRVAATPNTVQRLIKRGFEVAVASGAGEKARFSDTAYRELGAEIWSADQVWSSSDLILKVCPPSIEEAQSIREGAALMSFLWPAENAELIEVLQERKVTAIAMDCVPRISRAQKLDGLSSMSNISGYRAVIEAAHHYGSFFSAQFTAAGSVKQANVLVIGAGVAGLAALGAAKGLGARVRAFDVRAAAREQVESMGAEFVEVDMSESGEGEGGYAKEMSEAFIEAEMALFRRLAPETDVVITTALIPGRPAPKLWMDDALDLMKPGSVVVDLAAERGGNCTQTVPGEAVEYNGVTILGYTDMPSRLAPTASQLFGMNFVHYLKDIESGEGEVKFDLEDVIVRSSIVTHQGELLYPPPPLSELDPSSVSTEMKPAADKPAPVEQPTAAVQDSAPTQAAPAIKPKKKGHGHSSRPSEPSALDKELFKLNNTPITRRLALWAVIGLIWFVALWRAPAEGASPATINFLNHLSVFALSCFIGWQVIWNVTPALHTPLMSVTNAISGIILVGGMLQAHGELSTSSFFGGLAVLLAMINVVGGFAVTERMLKMFRK